MEEIGPTCMDLANTNRIQVQNKGLDTRIDVPFSGSIMHRPGKEHMEYPNMGKNIEGKKRWANNHSKSSKNNPNNKKQT